MKGLQVQRHCKLSGSPSLEARQVCHLRRPREEEPLSESAADQASKMLVKALDLIESLGLAEVRLRLRGLSPVELRGESEDRFLLGLVELGNIH